MANYRKVENEIATIIQNIDRTRDGMNMCVTPDTKDDLNSYSILACVPYSDRCDIIRNASEDSSLDRVMGSMCGMAIGDALGHPYEFEPAQDEPGRAYFDLQTLKFHGESNAFHLQRGQWTDDAAMGLCMADSLIIKRRFDGSDIRVRFWCWWNRGYNNSFSKEQSRSSSVGLGECMAKSLSDILVQRRPTPTYEARTEDAGNGSLIRLAPVAIYTHAAPLEEVYYYARLSSFTTHPGVIAAEGCAFLAHLIVRAVNLPPGPVDVRHFLDTATAEYYETSGLCTKSGYGYDQIKWLVTSSPVRATESCWNWKRACQDIAGTLKARGDRYNGYTVSSAYFGSYSLDGLALALWSIYNTDSLDAAVARSINLFGDADSHGCITGQLAGAIYGYKSIHPQFKVWLNKWDDHGFALRALLLHHLGLTRTPELVPVVPHGHNPFRDMSKRRQTLALLGTGTMMGAAVVSLSAFTRALKAWLAPGIARCNLLGLGSGVWAGCSGIVRQRLERQHVVVALIVGGAVGMFAGLVNFMRILQVRRSMDVVECDLLGVTLGPWSLLHWLAHNGHTMSIRALLAIAPCRARESAVTQNQWTPLHCASTQGHAGIVAALLASAVGVDAADARGHTALAIAVARGNSSIARMLLDARACPNMVDHKKGTALHLAAHRGDAMLTSLLLDSSACPNAADTGGWTPLLVACQKSERWPAALALLQHGACTTPTSFGQGLAALMLVVGWDASCCKNAVGAIATLLKHGADAGAVDRFGQTALHRACRDGLAECVAVLCRDGRPVTVQDNDGIYALQLLCDCCARFPEDLELVNVGMGAIIESDPLAAQRLDFGDSTALHSLCMSATVERTAPLHALRRLLAARADPTAEEDGGWTAAHFAAKHADKQLGKELLLVLRESVIASTCFWSSLDLGKERDTSNRKYLMRRGGAHRIPLQDRHDVLRGNVSMAGIAARIAEGRTRHIVVILGAGSSTSAGIPDFRSPMGLLTQSATRDLFSLDGFVAHPETFWSKSGEMFLGRTPTRVHQLLSELASQGILQRVYTQNVDGLEGASGIPDDLIVECHGNATRAICSASRSHPVKHTLAEISAECSMSVKDWKAPKCLTCGALLRPDIVFFGEPLPARFALHSGEDIRKCDLLMVVGTSLNVYPVAGLANRVEPLTPRVLINREAVGFWRGSRENELNYRDVYWEGDCDAGANELAAALGWEPSSATGVSTTASTLA